MILELNLFLAKNLLQHLLECNFKLSLKVVETLNPEKCLRQACNNNSYVWCDMQRVFETKTLPLYRSFRQTERPRPPGDRRRHQGCRYTPVEGAQERRWLPRHQLPHRDACGRGLQVGRHELCRESPSQHVHCG